MTRMNKPKYQIGDRIPESEFVVRGIAPQKNGEYLYFVQILGSDNTFVGNEFDIDNAIALINHKINRLINK
jgi:hypothetical protein